MGCVGCVLNVAGMGADAGACVVAVAAVAAGLRTPEASFAKYRAASSISSATSAVALTNIDWPSPSARLARHTGHVLVLHRSGQTVE